MDEISEIKPEKVVCPEGVWIFNTIFSIGQKVYKQQFNDAKGEEIARTVIEHILKTPGLNLFTISSFDGSKAWLNKDKLRSQNGPFYILQGCIPYSKGSRYGQSKIEGQYIFIDRLQYDKFIVGEALIEKPAQQNLEPAHPKPDFEYIPPYLSFMIQATKDLQLSANSRTSKEMIVEWLNKNWPQKLDGKSNRLIESMATLLRRPEDKKGGNTPWN